MLLGYEQEALGEPSPLHMIGAELLEEKTNLSLLSSFVQERNTGSSVVRVL